MADQPISIRVDSQTAEAYERATPEEKRKIQVLVNLWIGEFFSDDRKTLMQVLDEVRRKAQERGLTQEILDSILKNE
jgi:hypothetical protein